jgi:hypothetical protein
MQPRVKHDQYRSDSALCSIRQVDALEGSFRLPLPEGPIVAVTLLVPGFVGFAAAKLFRQWLFEWYLIYLLPGLVAGVAVGAFILGRWLMARDPARTRIGSRLWHLHPSVSSLVLRASYGACQGGYFGHAWNARSERSAP